MPHYDIRIRRSSGETRAVRACLARDVEAIAKARQLAEEDDAMEVWRGMDCIWRRETLPHLRRLAG